MPKFTAAAAKSLQSCPTLCDPIDGSPPGSPIPGILQARTLEWVAISFSNAWKWKVKSLSRVQRFATPWTAGYQAPLSMGFSRQEDWSGVPLNSRRTTWYVRHPNHPSHPGSLGCKSDIQLPSAHNCPVAFLTSAAPGNHLLCTRSPLTVSNTFLQLGTCRSSQMPQPLRSLYAQSLSCDLPEWKGIRKTTCIYTYNWGLPWWIRWWRIYLQCRRPRFNPWVKKIPWRRKWLPTLVFLPGESHGQRSLVCYSPRGCKDSYMSERLSMHACVCITEPLCCTPEINTL